MENPETIRTPEQFARDRFAQVFGSESIDAAAFAKACADLGV